MTTVSNIKKRYSLVEHTADTGISVRTVTINELFEITALAMFDMLVDLAHVSADRSWNIDAQADDLEQLMVTWLTELLYLHEVEEMIPHEIVVNEVSPTRISATVRGQVFDPNRHEIIDQIKAVTYHKLKVEETPDHKWSAFIIFDV